VVIGIFRDKTTRRRRSEITGLDRDRGCFDKGLLVTQRKTGWLEGDTWIKFARIAEGPLSRRVRGQGKDVGPDRLNDQEVTRLVEKVPDAVSAGDLFAPCATI